MKEESSGTMSAHNPLGRFRAIPTLLDDIDNDPEPMVHQQLARLKYFSERFLVNGASVLEFGCGAGFNCAYLAEKSDGGRIVGFDYRADVVDHATACYPGLRFLTADACDSSLAVEPGTWDYLVCFEVLEHVPDMPALIANLRRHVKPGGLVFLTTPNRDVFSLGQHPSPVNKEHIREPDLQELRSLLSGFRDVEILGQRFRDTRLLARWKEDVLEKIARVEDGTRWRQDEPTLTQRLRSQPILAAAYRNRWLRSAWKFVRWQLIGAWRAKRAAVSRPYSYQDFEIVSHDLSDAIWFCAVCRI